MRVSPIQPTVKCRRGKFQRQTDTTAYKNYSDKWHYVETPKRWVMAANQKTATKANREAVYSDPL
jgi:hypothetical protein